MEDFYDVFSFTEHGDSLYKRLQEHPLETYSPKIMEVDHYEDFKVSFNMINMGINPCQSIVINGERYFVKYPTLRNDYHDYELFCECFVAFLAEQLDINCVKPKILIDHKLGAVGIATEYFGEHFSLCDILDSRKVNSYSITESIVEHFPEKKMFVVNAQNISEELNKRACFDYMTRQSDRNLGNIAVKISRRGDKRYIHLVPMFDNANAFDGITARADILPEDNIISFLGEQELLNGRYGWMLDFFRDNFVDDESFYTLLSEFKYEYGLDQIIGEDKFYAFARGAQESIKRSISFCQLRKSPHRISEEAIYLGLQMHRDELKVSTALFKDTVTGLSGYLNKRGYDMFTKKLSGEFEIFDFYSDAEFMENCITPEERKAAALEIDRRRATADLVYLEGALKGYIFRDKDYYKSGYIFCGMDKTDFSYSSIDLLKTQKSQEEKMSVIGIVGVMDEFKELRKWYEDHRNDPEFSDMMEEVRQVLDKFSLVVHNDAEISLDESEIDSIATQQDGGEKK